MTFHLQILNWQAPLHYSENLTRIPREINISMIKWRRLTLGFWKEQPFNARGPYLSYMKYPPCAWSHLAVPLTNKKPGQGGSPRTTFWGNKELWHKGQWNTPTQGVKQQSDLRGVRVCAMWAGGAQRFGTVRWSCMIRIGDALCYSFVETFRMDTRNKSSRGNPNAHSTL